MNAISSRTVSHLALLLVNGYSFSNIKRVFTHAGVPLELFSNYEQQNEVSKSVLVNETMKKISELSPEERQYYFSELVEDCLHFQSFGPSYPDDTAYQQSLLKVEKSLKLDGYILDNGKLIPIIEGVVVEEETSLEINLNKLGLNVVLHHLNLSKQHYIDGKWDSANGQTRKALEQLTLKTAEKIASKYGEVIPTRYASPNPNDVRKYLRDKGFLNDKEFELLKSFYGYASVAGGNPGLSTETDERLRRFFLIGLLQNYIEKLSNI